MPTISACAVGSWPLVTWFHPRAITRPRRTTTAPKGPPEPRRIIRSESPMASRMNFRFIRAAGGGSCDVGFRSSVRSRWPGAEGSALAAGNPAMRTRGPGSAAGNPVRLSESISQPPDSGEYCGAMVQTPTSPTHPALRVLYSAEQIATRVREMGSTIAADLGPLRRDPIFVGVLKGACLFMADLARATPLDIE